MCVKVTFSLKTVYIWSGAFRLISCKGKGVFQRNTGNVSESGGGAVGGGVGRG